MLTLVMKEEFGMDPIAVPTGTHILEHKLSLHFATSIPPESVNMKEYAL